MSVASAWRTAVAVASPRHRAWRGLLASLTLDPDNLPRPVVPPGTRDFLMCGSPRSGTALLVAMLYQPPSVVTVMEPWDALRLPPAALFASFRDELAATGRLSRGRLDADALDRRGSVRWCRDGEQPHDVEVEDDFLLGIKFPAFWRYLDLLPETKFLICLRNPVEVIRSYEHTGGQLREGLDYDVPFNRAMNDHLRSMTSDPAVRRVLMYDYIHERLVPHLGRPNVLAVRYERWFNEQQEQLEEISAFLDVRLDRSKVRLRPSSSEGITTPAERDLLRRYCTTADSLGYEI